jgi:hypothetical protein
MHSPQTILLKEKKMKKIFAIFFAALIVLAVSGCASSPFSSQSELPVVTVVNNTGYAGYYLYLSPVTSDDWEEELLGDAILESGQSYRVRLAYPLSRENRYDFKMIDLDGDSYIKWNVLLSENAVIVFTFDDFVTD